MQDSCGLGLPLKHRLGNVGPHKGYIGVMWRGTLLTGQDPRLYESTAVPEDTDSGRVCATAPICISHMMDRWAFQIKGQGP